MGDDHSYSVVGDQIFINPCDDASMQLICQLQSDGGLKVISSLYGIIPEGVVFYPANPSSEKVIS